MMVIVVDAAIVVVVVVATVMVAATKETTVETTETMEPTTEKIAVDVRMMVEVVHAIIRNQVKKMKEMPTSTTAFVMMNILLHQQRCQQAFQSLLLQLLKMVTISMKEIPRLAQLLQKLMRSINRPAKLLSQLQQ